ncbi:hypothetical protein EYC80_008269 [Monilinia laxa]|uniref:Glycosyltransferase family 8 protein n=1 Tax=Monilinia laxa TaxID=61186 RepID=A0A5N6JVR0_MONLA|nr:hypothetical protein EYC80_008269 [Monilinia laxa]
MRRSRTSFACLFIVVAGILWLSHSTIKEAYNNVKMDWKAEMQGDGSFHAMGDGLTPNSNPPEITIQEPSPKLKFPPQSFPPLPDTPTNPGTSAFDNIKYPFQDDLSLPLPTLNLKTLANKWPHNYNPATPVGSRYAYATFMNTHNPSIRDPYFMAVQSLIYRVLWRPSSKTNSYPFIAFVASHITQEQRRILAGAGAIVRELDPTDWNPSPKDLASGEDTPILGRWRDTFSKLHMWSQTDFDRILFLDADAFPLENIDAMFDLAAPKACNALRQEADDFFPRRIAELSWRFLQNYRKYAMYNTNMADQAFFAWQFKTDGAFAATPLERRWGGFFPREDDRGKLKVVHEKLWASKGWLLEEWMDGWREMLEWYDGGGIEKERNGDEFFKPRLGKHVGNGKMP